MTQSPHPSDLPLAISKPLPFSPAKFFSRRYSASGLSCWCSQPRRDIQRHMTRQCLPSLEGFRAGCTRRKRKSCPYPPTSHEQAVWLRWYRVGLRSRRNERVMNAAAGCSKPFACAASSPSRLCRSCAGINLATLRQAARHADNLQKSDALTRAKAEQDFKQAARLRRIANYCSDADVLAEMKTFIARFNRDNITPQ